MRLFRKIVLWITLSATAALAAWSVMGAFQGACRAGRFFNSAPLVCFWSGLAILLAAGVIFVRPLLRSPAMRLGALLIIVGSMVNSEGGHAFARRHLGIDKAVRGYMILWKGQPNRNLLEPYHLKQTASLPFSLELKDFWIESYSKETTWLLVAETPANRPGGEPQQTLLRWRIGQQQAIPGTRASVRVLEYIPQARAIYPRGARRVLVIESADGREVTVPGKVGSEVTLEEPKLTVRITEVYSHLTLHGTGAGRRIVEDPCAPHNPAVMVEIEAADGTKRVRPVIQLAPARGLFEAPQMRYVEDRPTKAVPDPASDVPAMKLEICLGDRHKEVWLVPEGPDPSGQLELRSVFAPADGRSVEKPPEGTLYLVMPPNGVEDYKSRVAVMKEGRAVAERVIEASHPLHYGGYHFYFNRHYCNLDELCCVILSVRSDSGLTVVYAGFALLCGGVFWWGWVQPAWRFIKKRSGDDN